MQRLCGVEDVTIMGQEEVDRATRQQKPPLVISGIKHVGQGGVFYILVYASKCGKPLGAGNAAIRLFGDWHRRPRGLAHWYSREEKIARMKTKSGEKGAHPSREEKGGAGPRV